MSRAAVVVLDACGVGATDDAAAYGDDDADTLGHLAAALGGVDLPTLGALGLGSAAGMMMLTAVMSLPLVVFTSRFRTFRAAAQLIAGVGSIAFGLWWMWSSGAMTLLA